LTALILLAPVICYRILSETFSPVLIFKESYFLCRNVPA
jgi:hypothetical protein